MTRILGLLAMLFVANSGHAQIITSMDRTTVPIVFLANAELDGEELTIAEGEPVLTTDAISPRAVRLKENVTIGAVGSGVDLKAGDVLFGRYEESVWTYCALADLNAESRTTQAVATGILTLGYSLLLEGTRPQYVNCLHDAEDDGVFDTGWGGGSDFAEGALIAIELRRKSLSSEPEYERIDPRDGPKMPVSITWEKKRRAGTITFEMFAGGQRLATKGIAIPGGGGEPADFEIGDVRLRLVSYDAEAETITVEIVAGFPARYTRLQAVRTVTTTYGYY